MTAASDLRTIALAWTDLHTALGAPNVIGGFGRGLHSYLTLADALDPEEIEAIGHRRAAVRFLEQDAHLLGQRPIPIRLHVYEVMRTVEAALVEVADRTARAVQRHPIQPPAPRRAAYAKTRADRVMWADHAQRIEAARADAFDPRRWRYTGTRTAPYAALWLLGRVTGRPGPFRPLDEQQARHIKHVALKARHRIEQALDTGAETAQLAPPCPDCGGTITVHGGAGSSPLANCAQCGGIWTEHGAIAA